MTVEELLQCGRLPERIQLSEEELSRLVRKYKGLLKQTERDQAFWAATNENLKRAYGKLDDQDKELSKAYGIIREDLVVASQIQAALLPMPCERMAQELELAVHHKQLAEVGGDYYDFFRTRSDSYAIGVFDISGHGVSAALVMTYLKAQFMAAMETFESPREIVERINNVSHPFLKAVKKYATVNFIVFSPERLRYVCGGGFGILVRGKKHHSFEKKDPFLGLRLRPFHEHELPFHDGDLLAIYTDGMVEAQNAAGEDYSVNRLNGLVVRNAGKPVGEILDLCVKDYQEFREKDSDDVTLIIMRKKT
jgi:sigma-B regulation protein RsbU (phosphoserine phosphatase)